MLGAKFKKPVDRLFSFYWMSLLLLVSDTTENFQRSATIKLDSTNLKRTLEHHLRWRYLNIAFQTRENIYVSQLHRTE